jgi:hypothetical protein
MRRERAIERADGCVKQVRAIEPPSPEPREQSTVANTAFYVSRRFEMTGEFRLVLPLIESADFSDEDKKFVKASLWRDGATPEITTPEQFARYKRIAGELSRKYDAQTRNSLSFIRSPDGVLLTSLEARMTEWEEDSEPNGI